MSILVQRYFRRSRAVEDLAEEWQIEHKNAMLARDIEELIFECIELGRLANHVWKSLFEMLFAAKITNSDEIGDKFRMAIARTKSALALVERGLGEAEKLYQIDKAAEFRATVNAIGSLSEEFEKVWPRVDNQMAKEALEDYQRGDYVDSGDLLANARG